MFDYLLNHYREFDLSLQREEVEEVDHLRDNWQKLTTLADSVSTSLLREKRGAFEQELDKQVKVTLHGGVYLGQIFHSSICNIADITTDFILFIGRMISVRTIA